MDIQKDYINKIRKVKLYKRNKTANLSEDEMVIRAKLGQHGCIFITCHFYSSASIDVKYKGLGEKL